jgi:hypothetical protein
MSVAVGAAASEGLALTTDSRTMQQRKEGSSSHYRVASNTAEKLFLAEGRLGVATYEQTQLVLEVRTDGAADLTEVEDRVGALSGRLAVDETPAGDPRLRVELPCA